MMAHEIDPVVAALGALRHTTPPALDDKLFTGWLTAPSRIGAVFVAFTPGGVQFVRSTDSLDRDPSAFAHAYRQRFGRPLRTADRAPAGLLAVLRGRRGPTPPLDLSGLSEFERNVLAVTRTIPTGETRPYGWVAREAGHPRAVRAAASALARNPVPLLVPCHRVVRADGAIGRYLFGARRKETLLREENTNLDDVTAFVRRGVHYLGSDTTGIVCFPTCHHARRITPAHRVGFATLADATAVGYRPCRACRPAVAA
jgi:O-6-methylguanine DNA methyltransferase